MGDFGALDNVLLAPYGDRYANTSQEFGAYDDQRLTIPQAILLEQLQRSLPASVTTAAADATTHAGAMDGIGGGGGAGGRLPRNLTLIFNELQRFSFRSEASLQPYRTHGMTDEEYSRFVSDMWIGIVLTLLMVLIVLALCMWFLYHKFQQWKRQYNNTHDAHTLTHVVSTSALQLDGDGGGAGLNDETLPQYTLVSGLPTYDDALEQIRHTNSTNHLLINHQTLMKLFGSAPATMGGSSKDTNNDTITSNTFCTNCNTPGTGSGNAVPPYASADNLNKSQTPADRPDSPRMYLARIESCQLEQIHHNGSDSRRSSLQSYHTVSPSTTSSGGVGGSGGVSSGESTTVITTGSGHRFVCTAVPPAMLMAAHSRRRASDCPTPAVGGFRRLLSLNPEVQRRMPAPPMPLAMRRPGGPLRLSDVPSCSLGSLSVRRDQQQQQQQHPQLQHGGMTPNRWSLGGMMEASPDGRLSASPSAAVAPEMTGSCGNVFASALNRHRASLY